MWVLVTIYHRLLRHIEQRNFDVFSTRVGVPAYEKLSILGCGLFKTLGAGSVGLTGLRTVTVMAADWQVSPPRVPCPTRVTTSACWRSGATLAAVLVV